jgi:hypothetical protein
MHRLAAANDRLRVAHLRVPALPGHLDMNTASDLAMPTTIAARSAQPRPRKVSA